MTRVAHALGPPESDRPPLASGRRSLGYFIVPAPGWGFLASGRPLNWLALIIVATIGWLWCDIAFLRPTCIGDSRHIELLLGRWGMKDDLEHQGGDGNAQAET